MAQVTAQNSALKSISGAVWTSNLKTTFPPAFPSIPLDPLTGGPNPLDYESQSWPSQAPLKLGFSEGHVVYAPVQIPHALQRTSEQRYELQNPPDFQTDSKAAYTNLPIWTETPFSDYNSLCTRVTCITGYDSVRSRVAPGRRPCLVLFANKPVFGKYIVAPITGFDGNVVGGSEFADHRNSRDPDLLRMVYPIEPTPPFRIPQLAIELPGYWQKVVVFPKWARRQERHKTRRPQYILLGKPPCRN